MIPYDPQDSDKLKEGAKQRIENRIAERKEKSPLQIVQENCKKLVERGEMTKDQAIQIILQKAMDMLEDLKMPENQDWEVEQYGYMARKVN